MKELFGQLYIRKILKYALYLVLSMIFQTMFLSGFRIMGICPFVLPAVVVSVGMFEGPIEGVVFALIMGLFTDMAYVESTILYTVMFPSLAFFSGFAAQFFINRRFFAYMGLAAAAELACAFVQVIACAAGDAWSVELVKTALLQTAFSIPLAAFAYLPPARWIR